MTQIQRVDISASLILDALMQLCKGVTLSDGREVWLSDLPDDARLVRATFNCQSVELQVESSEFPPIKPEGDVPVRMLRLSAKNPEQTDG